MPVDEIKPMRFNFTNGIYMCIGQDYLVFVITILRLIDSMASATLLYTLAIASGVIFFQLTITQHHVYRCVRKELFERACRHVHVHLCIILILECINFHIFVSWIVSAHLEVILLPSTSMWAVTVLFLPSINVSSV